MPVITFTPAEQEEIKAHWIRTHEEPTVNCKNEVDQKSCDVDAQADLTDFPFAEVKLLLDMVLGNSPFDFRTAIKAVAKIADYAASLDLFGATELDQPCPKGVEAAVLLQAAVYQAKAAGGGGIEAQGIWDLVPTKYLLELVIRQVMEWLAEKIKEA